MQGYFPNQVTKPANDQDFETLCGVLFRELLCDPNVKKVGTGGQKQDGVDLIGYRDQNAKKPVGVQCKWKGDGEKLTDDEVRVEVGKALKFKPALTEYFIVTTAKDDTKLDQLAGQLQQEARRQGRKISISVWGWKTLEERINEHEPARKAFDPGFSPSLQKHDQKLDAILESQADTKRQFEVLSTKIGSQSAISSSSLPAKYADRELEEEFSRALKRRGFGEANWPDEIAQLAQRIVDGELSDGSAANCSQVLRRASWANADKENLEKAKAFHRALQGWDSAVDDIYNALTLDAEGRSDEALRALRKIATPAGRHVFFNVLRNAKGGAAALDWITEQKIRLKDLTPHGALHVISLMTDLQRFDAALDAYAELPSEFIAEAPALLMLKASLLVASVLPADQKAVVFSGLPLQPRMLQLASDPERRAKLNDARSALHGAIDAATAIGLAATAEFLREYDLWLRLETKELSAAARAELASALEDPTKTLQSVRLALSYNVPFNREALARHLKRQRDLGGWGNDERVTAFLLAFHAENPGEAAALMDDYRDEFFESQIFNDADLAGMEIGILAQAKRYQDARDRVAEHESKGRITRERAEKEIASIAAAEGGTELEHTRQQYIESKSPATLRALVAMLVSKNDVGGLAVFAPQLAAHSRQIGDLRIAIRSLYHEQQYSTVVVLCEEFQSLVAIDDELLGFKAWSLFHLGRILEARELARANYKRDADFNSRELVINTAIESGDWGHIQTVLGEEIAKRDSLDAPSLMRLAQLAMEVGSPYVDQFRDASLGKAGDDPGIHLSAYGLSIARGIEDEQSHLWFQKAAVMSGPEGPVQKVDLKDMIAKNADWNSHVEKVDRGIKEGKVPILLAARHLRRQPVDFMLGQAIRNTRQADPRYIYPLLAFSGVNKRIDLASLRVVGFDVSTIITLDRLGILEKAINTFDRVIIAPSTLSSMFIERQYLRVHQPSQVAKAKRFSQLSAEQKLLLFEAPSPADVALVTDVGVELAAMLVSAAANADTFVLTKAPATKVGSFLEQEVDLSTFRKVLPSLRSIPDFLANAGYIDATLQNSAKQYLEHVDKGWAGDAVLTKQSKVLLDDLAATYLDQAGVLDAVCKAVREVRVSKDVIEHTEAVLSWAAVSEDLLEAVERIRRIVSGAIDRGAVTFFKRRTKEENGGEIAFPALEILSDLSQAETIFADDRFFNKEEHWVNQRRRVPSASTLQLIDTLFAKKVIDSGERLALRHQLRVNGYCLVPIEQDELLEKLDKATINEGKVVETVELRAVRDSISLVQRADLFQPSDGDWLLNTRFFIIKAINHVWAHVSDAEIATARADWLLGILPSPLAWSVKADQANWDLSCDQEATQTAFLLMSIQMPREMRAAHAEWARTRIVLPIKNSRAWIWDRVEEKLKQTMSAIMEVRRGKKT